MSSTNDLTPIAEVLILAGVAASSRKAEEERLRDQQERREAQAGSCHVSVEAYHAFRSDRWWPGTKTTEFTGPQLVGGDRAWLAKRGYG